MELSLFYQITIVLIAAGLIALLVSYLKQPSIIAFILTGLVVGPFGYSQMHGGSALEALGQIGITLLLFMVGLELDFKRIRQLGKVALYAGVGQIVFTFGLGYILSRVLHFSNVTSLYIAIALTFSSTVIVVKLLSQKKDLQSLYGRICVGFLLVQDFVAMGILLFLGGAGGSQDVFASLPSWQYIITLLVKALIITLVLWWLSKQVFPRFVSRLGKSDELLLIFAVGWALGLAAVAASPVVGFSLEVGGFLAGLALANSHVHYEISARIRSLRDFFIIIFFVVFGTQLVFTGIGALIVPAVAFSLFVLVGNPLIVIVILAAMGYKPRTAFFAAVTVAQISEFSFVVVALGNRLGHLSDQVMGLVTLVGIITMAGSSYMILYSDKLYHWLQGPLAWFDFSRGGRTEKEEKALKNHVVVAGANRLGRHVIEVLRHRGDAFVIVDFDPEVIERYLGLGYAAICGDITDPYIQEQAGVERARLIISTIPDFNDNVSFIEVLKKAVANRRVKPKLIFASQGDVETADLYERGVDYALSPHFIGGLHLSKILEDDNGFKSLKKLKDHHLRIIQGKL